MNKPVRVLQMTASLFSGGSQNMIVNIYKAIDRQKIQFDFIIDHPEYLDLKPVIEELGAKVYVMPSFKVYNAVQVIKAWNDFFKAHPEYKIIHSHSRSYASLYLTIARKYGLNTIIHSHNTSNGEGIKSKIKNLLQLSLKDSADYYFGCSYNAGKWLFGDEIVRSNKFHVLNNAIDTNKFKYNKKIRDQYRKELGIENNNALIQVGEFNYQKNHEFTIDVFNELAKIDNKAKLILVGKGEYLEKIKEKINAYNLKDKVLLLGRRDDVNNLLQAADCFIMPSNFEGLSLAAIEAQASGIKCIFSDKVLQDVKVTDNCKFLPLEIDKWVNECKDNIYIRKDTKKDIVNAGYDVQSTAKWLENFYLDIIK